MRRRNKSAIYGYYGGVTKENHYVPPGAPDFVPQPAGITFTEEDRQLILAAAEGNAFVQQNAPNIVLRANTDSQSNNVDTFVLYTSANPQDVIIYKSSNDTVVLDDVAGSGIVSDSNEPLDGGFF